MTQSEQNSLPYDMGNAGDLLKHGGMAEFLRTRLIFDRGRPIRFLDLFAGEPFSRDTCGRIVQRVNKLSGCALHEGQPDISSGRYYGSSMLAQKLGKRFKGQVKIIAGDCNKDRQKRLQECGMTLFEDAFPEFPDSKTYDAYKALDFILGKTTDSDLILIDPFGCFLRGHADDALPKIGKLSKCSTVLLFALNLDPFNPVGRKFDDLLQKHLSGSLIMTCPPICGTKVKGEEKYHADVILASPFLHGSSAEFAHFQDCLENLATRIADALELSERGYAMIMPRTIGRDWLRVSSEKEQKKPS